MNDPSDEESEDEYNAKGEDMINSVISAAVGRMKGGK